MSDAKPKDNEKRVRDYQRQNGRATLTVRQERSVRRAERRALKEKRD